MPMHAMAVVPFVLVLHAQHPAIQKKILNALLHTPQILARTVDYAQPPVLPDAAARLSCPIAPARRPDTDAASHTAQWGGCHARASTLHLLRSEPGPACRTQQRTQWAEVPHKATPRFGVAHTVTIEALPEDLPDDEPYKMCERTQTLFAAAHAHRHTLVSMLADPSRC